MSTRNLKVALTLQAFLSLLSLGHSRDASILCLLLQALIMVGVDKVAADHYTCATLARFTMNSDDIGWILAEPLVSVDAEAVDELEGWRVVVVKTKIIIDDALDELFGVILTLRAQVVNLVPVWMTLVEEADDFGHGVAVPSFIVIGGVPHGNDALVNVAQIEVEIVLNVTIFLL